VRGVTPAQKRTLQIVTGLALLQGRAPSLGEIADALHIRKPTAHERLYWLEKKGLWCSRSRAVTSAGLTVALGTLPLAA
jgi:Mn-dependent DtxR family transcriptional regulator